MKAKTAEVEALTESIAEKTKRIGEPGVEIVGLIAVTCACCHIESCQVAGDFKNENHVNVWSCPTNIQ